MKLNDKQLISILAECASACHHCSTACLEEEDVKMMANCIKLDLDCAAICEISAAFLSRNSENAKFMLHECVEICTRCAAECAKHEDMEHCRKCAEVCRKCADACKRSSNTLFHSN